jgi:3-oxoacyl-[acyl-carrier protein] reductase
LTDAPTALITGSNRGLGRGIAEALYRGGYQLISLNRTVTGEGWLGELPCDLSRPDQIEAAGAVLRESVDRLDVCVLNAAVRRLGSLERLSATDWETSLSVNLSSAVYLIQQTLPQVRAAQGTYVVVGSHAATRFFEGGAAYSASKAGLRAVVETLLLEERPRGVRAMLLSPGAIANRPDDVSAAKMSPASIGDLICRLISAPGLDVTIGEIEVRPTVLEPALITGIDRLQSV